MGRSLKIRSRMKSELKVMLHEGPRPSTAVLRKVQGSRKALGWALAELGGSIYFHDGVWWWSLAEKKVDDIRKKLKRLGRRGDIKVSDAMKLGSPRLVRMAAKELGLIRVRKYSGMFWKDKVL